METPDLPFVVRNRGSRLVSVFLGVLALGFWLLCIAQPTAGLEVTANLLGTLVMAAAGGAAATAGLWLLYREETRVEPDRVKYSRTCPLFTRTWEALITDYQGVVLDWIYRPAVGKGRQSLGLWYRVRLLHAQDDTKSVELWSSPDLPAARYRWQSEARRFNLPAVVEINSQIQEPQESELDSALKQLQREAED